MLAPCAEQKLRPPPLTTWNQKNREWSRKTGRWIDEFCFNQTVSLHELTHHGVSVRAKTGKETSANTSVVSGTLYTTIWLRKVGISVYSKTKFPLTGTGLLFQPVILFNAIAFCRCGLHSSSAPLVYGTLINRVHTLNDPCYMKLLSDYSKQYFTHLGWLNTQNFAQA